MVPHLSATADDGFAALTPIFAELGRTVYVCQCFEQSMLALHALLSHETEPREGQAFDAALDRYSRRTLGTMLKQLRERVQLPEHVEEFLWSGVQMRNQVIHGFASLHTRNLFEPKGRLRIEKELAALKREVMERDNLVHSLLDALLRKYGVSVACLVGSAGELWEYLNRSADGPAH